jgi:hypothetical protein
MNKKVILIGLLGASALTYLIYYLNNKKSNNDSSSTSYSDIVFSDENPDEKAYLLADKLAKCDNEQDDDSIKSNIISLPDSYCSYDALKTILENQGYELIKKNNFKFSTEKLEIQDNSQIQAAVISLNNNSSIINGVEFPIGLLYKETSWWQY